MIKRVIKLGGSLMSDAAELRRCLKLIVHHNSEKTVVVPGGGEFADHVRQLQDQWQFDDVTAHQMAITAMKQMALLLKSLEPLCQLAETVAEINLLAVNFPIVIWSPEVRELDSSGIHASWDITSDSLSAWLAGQLSADELILLKSAPVPADLNLSVLQKIALLDSAFDRFSQNATYKITLLNKYSLNENTLT